MPIPDDVLARILATADEVLDIPDLAGFSVALGRDAESEGRAVGADAVVTLFRTETSEEALVVRDRLVARYGDHPRLRRLTDVAATGRVVYLALYATPAA